MRGLLFVFLVTICLFVNVFLAGAQSGPSPAGPPVAQNAMLVASEPVPSGISPVAKIETSTWLSGTLDLFGLKAPRWAWLGLLLLAVLEWFMGWSHSIKANSLLGGIAKLLTFVLGKVPVLGPILEIIARQAKPSEATPSAT